MSSFEQACQNAIDKKQIEGIIVEGRSTHAEAYSQTFGTRKLLDGTTKPLASDNIVLLASSTKLLTTIAALQCCERKQLALDADLADLLPALTGQGVISDTDEAVGAPNMEALRKPLTLRHLLTHSSGLAYPFISPVMARWHEANIAPDDSASVPRRFTQPLIFQPGEGWMYGPGIDWAGYLVEQVTGVKLDEYFRIHLLQPLGINDTELSFFPVKEGLAHRMPEVNPQDPNGFGLSATGGISLHSDPLEECFGGQGGYGSCSAYAAVLLSLLLNDEKLLTRSSVKEMLSPQLEAGAKRGLDSALQGPMGQFFKQDTSGTDLDFGLGGILVGNDGDGGMGKGSMTWGGGLNSVWLIDPTRQVCGIACPQLGLPTNFEAALDMKAIFRREIGNQLSQ